MALPEDYDTSLVSQVNDVNKAQNARGIYGGADPSTGKALTPLMPPSPSAGISSNNPYGLSDLNAPIALAPSARSMGVIPGMEYMGPLGPDLEGAVKGTQARQEYNINKNKDIRETEMLKIAQADLGIKQEDLNIRKDENKRSSEEFGWKRDDRQRDLNLKQGMIEASKTGGYTGVIQFLMQTDPDKAIEYHAKKLALDRDMMTTDTMKLTSANDKAKAMAEGYGILGKMGMGLLSMPAEDRPAALQQMQPILKQVLGENAPQTLEEATPVLMLGAYQATDANKLAELKWGQQKYQTQSGQLLADYNKGLDQGLNPSSPFMLGLQEQMKAENLKGIKAESEITQNQLLGQKNEMQTTATALRNKDALQKNVDDRSKAIGFTDQFENYKTAEGLIQEIHLHPENSIARNNLALLSAKMYQKGTISETDFIRGGQGAAGIEAYKKKLAEWGDGKTHLLNDSEVADMAAVFEATMDRSYEDQSNWETQFKGKNSQHAGKAFLDQIMYPSESVKQFRQTQKYPELLKQYSTPDLPLNQLPFEDKQAIAKNLIEATTPEQVKWTLDAAGKKWGEMQKKAAFQAQQQQQFKQQQQQ